jgi:hypothetical protein
VRVLAPLALVLLGALPAAGEHEIWYRYTVLGYATDGGGRPRAGERVELVRERTQLSYRGDTDGSGLYVIVARLGDESAGEILTLRLGGVSARVTATFDPTNHSDERGTRIDFDGARVIERAAAFRATLAKLMGADAR